MPGGRHDFSNVYNAAMRNGLLMVGIAAIVVIAGAWHAFNRSFTKASDTIVNTDMVTQLEIKSSAFEPGGSIPAAYTCDEDKTKNPPLMISSVPEGAKSLVLIMDDPDIPAIFKEQRGLDAFDHWTLFNIPPETTEIPEGGSVGTAGANGTGQSAYYGPCPPKEYEPSEHRYFFKLYVLDVLLDLEPGATKKQVEAAMAGHIIEQTELMGTYKRK